MMMLSALAIENVGRRNGVSFKTGMVEKKLRSKNTSAPTNEIHAIVATVWSSSHWCRGPSSSTYWSEPRNTASDIACNQSIFFSMPRFGSSTLPSKGNPMAMDAPGTMLMKNSQCQLAVSVIHPPIVGPSVGASVDTRPRIAGTIARSLPVNSVKPVANTVGTIAPPTKPWIARNSVMDSIDHAIPHIRLASVNATALAVKSQRVDTAWEMNAANGIITISAIRYAVCTQAISSGPADNPA